MKEQDIQKLYKERFFEKEIIQKNKIWSILCNSFFQKYIPENSTILDIGAGYCEFLNNIKAQRKIAVDKNPDIRKFAEKSIHIFNIDCTNMKEIDSQSIDIIFTSNFLEHLNNKEDVLLTLKEAYRILKPDGIILIMGPNIKYLADSYWDFFDHLVPLSHLSLSEILQTIGFKLEKVYNKFLPYSTKNKLPKFSFLIKLYLKFSLFYKILGKQFFIIARKKASK